MLATLRGEITERIGDIVVVECGGVGYGVLCTFEDAGLLQAGQTAKLYIYEHIRETAHDLFGFTQPVTKRLFEQLLDVNGVGPKMALSIMNIGNAGAVRQAIANGDTQFISQAQGVGRRVAERVIVDLKDKVGLVAGQDATSFLQAPGVNSDEAVQALVVLGYSAQDASMALKDVAKSLPTEDRIRAALRGK